MIYSSFVNEGCKDKDTCLTGCFSSIGKMSLIIIIL